MTSRNKRKRSDTADDQLAPSPTPPKKAFKRGLLLTDLADELILSVLLYFDYKERSKLRYVCSRLLGIIDAMPPPPNLWLTVRQDEFPGSIGWSLGGLTTERSWASRFFARLTPPSAYIFMKDQEEGVALWSRENLPLLKAIRPAKLNVESACDDESTGKVDVKMLKRLGKDVGKTVTNLTVEYLQAANVDEATEAFSLFFESNGGAAPLTKLKLSSPRFPLEDTLSAITCLQDLISLDLYTSEQFTSDRPFSALTSLSNLEELRINLHYECFQLCSEEDVATNFMNTCTAMSGLKRLRSNVLGAWEHERTRSQAFARMLQGLPNLEELGGIQHIGPQAWQQIHVNGSHKKLRKLVHGCNHDFPLLVELELHIQWLDCSVGELVLSLENLKNHPSLLDVKCGWHDRDEIGDFFVKCEQVFGERMKLSRIDHLLDN